IPHLLTFGMATYSHDSRFQIFFEKPNDWKLQIQFPKIEDEGIYECQVSTNPPLVQRTKLR
ncbi:Putative LOC101460593, partial [Caligus rogercresseyi]